MKRIIPILLLAIILFSQLGYHCISIIRQHQAKEAMEQQILAGIPESNLTVFDAHSPNIIWEEKGKEFFLDGKLYDVAKTRIIDGKTFLYCIGDSKEDQVVKDRSNAVRSGTDQNTTTKTGIHSINFHLGDWTFTTAEKPSALLSSATKKYFNYSVSINSPFIKINTPPPKFYI